MGHHDLGQVFLILLFAHALPSGGSGGGAGKPGGGGGALGAGVHIGLVVVAEIGEVVAPFQGAGEGLEADVIGAAVAADGQDFEVVLDFALPFQHLIGALHPGRHCRGVLEGGVDIAVHPGGVGVLEGGDLQAGGGVADDGLVLRVQGTHHGPAGDARAAAGAQPVPGLKALRLASFALSDCKPSHCTSFLRSRWPCGCRPGRSRRSLRSFPTGQRPAWPGLR